MSKTSSVISIGTGIVIQTILGLITEIIVARYFTLVDFATYQQTIMVLSFAPLFTFGFIDSIIYFVSYYKNDRKVLSNTFYHLILVGIITSVVIYLLRYNIAIWFENPALEKTLRFYCIIPFFSFLISLIPNYFIGKKKFTTSRNISIILSGIISVTLISVLFFSPNLLPAQLLLFRLSATILAALLTLLVLLFSTGWFLKFFDFNYYCQLSKYAFSLGITRFIPLLNLNMDKLMVSAMLGPISFAYYKIGAREIPFAGIIILSLGSTFLPFYVNLVKENNLEEIRRLWRKGTVRAAIFNFPIGLFCFVFAPFIITTLFGKTYEPSANIFRIYSLILIIRLNDGDVLAKAFNANKIILQASLLALVFNFISNYILIKLMSGIGAALASLITVALAWSYRIVKYSKLLDCDLRLMMPWKQLGVLIFLALCCASIAKVVALILGEETILSVSIGSLLALIIYVIFVWKASLLEYPEKMYFIKLLNLPGGENHC
ncbi:MAG: polysaccharide biosynthesis protein [Desulfobacterales bacterium]|nr:MAG: polysaccharide biosynthesis protein [Desulfobacterales bacterium]